MGQKVHPYAFRLAGIYSWPSKWFSRKDARAWIRQDVEIRALLKKQLVGAGLDRVEIERQRGALTLNLHVAKPGFVIGRGGAGIEELKKKLKRQFLPKGNLVINIHEVDKPSLAAGPVAEGVKLDLEKRIPFRRACKSALERVNKAGGLGAKIMVAGRLNGAEIARTEKFAFGSIPLQNLRADISYTIAEAHTIYGKIGIKVWIYRGEIFSK